MMLSDNGNFDPKNILIGISGGIAAYKVPFLIRLLGKLGYSVKVIITDSAKDLVGISTLETLSKNPVYTDVADKHFDMGHIRLAEWADLFVLVPATANSIAKMAHGISDNLLSTTFLSLTCPIVVVPAMNTAMWENPATIANIKLLKERGITVLPTASGELACGKSGNGRMIEPSDIVQYLSLVLENKNLYQKFTGKRICISSGPTREKIDDVRSITNNSSGKMGGALARAAIFSGAEVVVVSGMATEKLPDGCKKIFVNSALEMYDEMIKNLSDCDFVIMAAAVGDFRVENLIEGKIPREDNTQYSINLVKNPDIAKKIGETKSERQKLIVFSLETEENVERATKKMNLKNADFCVLNSAQNAIGKDKSKITVIDKNGNVCEFGEQEKIISAGKILELLQ
jgi:phosphopantothenoylcysteine decarboxylase/phosphopantothenate--cysteine ligase